MQMEAVRGVASRIAIQRPEFSEILDRVRKLRPDIDARALATEKARRVPAETMGRDDPTHVRTGSGTTRPTFAPAAGRPDPRST